MSFQCWLFAPLISLLGRVRRYNGSSYPRQALPPPLLTVEHPPLAGVFKYNGNMKLYFAVLNSLFMEITTCFAILFLIEF